MTNKTIPVVLTALAAAVMIAASAPEKPERNATESGDARSSEAFAANRARDMQVAASASANFQVDWYSINSGGETDATSAGYRSGMSIGQPVAGEGSSANYRMGVGFWPGATAACAVALTGDVNLSESLTSADIIYLVNFVFKSQAAPLPCEAAGDVNCSGGVT